MLYNDDDKKKEQDKLIHADSDNKNLTDDVKANENSLFGKPNVSPEHGHDSLFGSSYDDAMNDDLVSSSFAVSFKANDPVNTVSDKLKEEQDAAANTSSDALQFEDDLEGFEFDSSVSAFKPLNNAPAPEHVAKKETTIEKPAAKVEAPKPQAQPKPAAQAKDPFEGIDDVPAPKFTDDDKDFLDMAGLSDPKDDKLFKSGDDLDFATSSKDEKASPFAHAKKPEAAPQPKNNIDMPPVTKQEAPKQEAKDKNKPADTESAQIESFGTVSSGVNAFKNNGAADNQEPVQAKAPSPFAKKTSEPAPAPAQAQAQVQEPQQAKAPEKNDDNKGVM